MTTRLTTNTVPLLKAAILLWDKVSQLPKVILSNLSNSVQIFLLFTIVTYGKQSPNSEAMDVEDALVRRSWSRWEQVC